jgi:hypothetical protein
MCYLLFLLFPFIPLLFINIFFFLFPFFFFFLYFIYHIYFVLYFILLDYVKHRNLNNNPTLGSSPFPTNLGWPNLAYFSVSGCNLSGVVYCLRFFFAFSLFLSNFFIRFISFRFNTNFKYPAIYRPVNSLRK